jgi:hypothetical protein
MEWTITLNKEEPYAEIATSGIATRRESFNMAKEIAVTLGEEKIKNVLIDHRNISAVSGDAMDVYYRPVEFQKIGMFLGIKVAEMVKPEHREFFNFLETVCVNRGYRFRIFDDRQSALDWLLQP